MGWFNKKEDKFQGPSEFKATPSLPKLPDLPELPKLENHPQGNDHHIHQLPSFPNNSIGQKFSQNTIKDAIRGQPEQMYPSLPEIKKGDRVFESDEFVPPKKNMRKMQKPLRMPIKKEYDFPKTEEIEESDMDFDFDEPELDEHEEKDMDFDTSESNYDSDTSFAQKNEPVFIRIDKFEAALKTFDKTKREMADIEKTLNDIVAVKEDEDKELAAWQENLIKIKEQIEKVDKDIFSKIE